MHLFGIFVVSKMSDARFSRLLQLQRKQRIICNPTLCVLLLLMSSCSSVSPCPAQCLCENTVVNCSRQNMRSIPQSLPGNTSKLYLNGNSIMVLNNESFPVPLEHLTHLYLSGCQVEELGYMAFKNLPQLHLLDLSDNNILQLNSEPWRKDNKIEILNLSNALYNHSYIVSLSNTLKHNLPKVLHLNLSNNDLVFLPEGIIAGLPLLTILDLRNNSLVSFRNITFGNTALEKLDLRDNAFKNLPNATLLELSSIPDLHVSLSGNPWRCDCDIEDMLIWLERHTFIDDRLNLSCAEPKNRRNTLLVHLEHSYLPCWSDVDVLDRALEPSYVFLGLVLALIGVIFLLVLYLNRKGIKRWMYNIRDACRDHMEGYHYRYENSTDPRLANFNLNSDV